MRICGDIHSLNSLKEQSFDVSGHPRFTQVGFKKKKNTAAHWLVLHFRGEKTEQSWVYITSPFTAFSVNSRNAPERWNGFMFTVEMLEYKNVS